MTTSIVEIQCNAEKCKKLTRHPVPIVDRPVVDEFGAPVLDGVGNQVTEPEVGGGDEASLCPPGWYYKSGSDPMPIACHWRCIFSYEGVSIPGGLSKQQKIAWVKKYIVTSPWQWVDPEQRIGEGGIDQETANQRHRTHYDR